MTYRRRFESSNYNSEWYTSETYCNRCGEKPTRHNRTTNIDRRCDNPRYLSNYHKECGCKRTPLYEMSQRQKEEGDPDYICDTHCCFCKRATRLTDLLPYCINNEWYERCQGCSRKGKGNITEREELYELRKSQIEKRERSQSFEPEQLKKVKPNPPATNVYADGPIYNPKATERNGESSKETIDWAKDTEEEILRKANFNNKGKNKVINWREHEEAARSKYCTPLCQFFDHRQLKNGQKHMFDANLTMVHDTKCCPYGALEYDEAGIEYQICTCYRKASKYCFEHDHETNPCTCKPEVFWEIRSFAGERCRWEQCMYHGEYQHCEHSYCWKHQKYGFDRYTKCKECAKEIGIQGNEYWSKLAISIVEHKVNKQLIGGLEKRIFKELTKEQKENEIKKILNITPLKEEVDKEKEELKGNEFQRQLKEYEKEKEELIRQLDQIKSINQDLEGQIESEQEERQRIWEELSTEKKKVEVLAQQIERYEVTEKITWEKETSLFHCPRCKETEKHYEYCTASTIECYKNMYENERKINMKLNEDLKEYNNLFEEYGRQEKVKEEEVAINNEEFNEIMKTFDSLFNTNMYAEELI
jgi:hypothetical protein